MKKILLFLILLSTVSFGQISKSVFTQAQKDTIKKIAGDSSQVAETRAKSYTDTQFNNNPKGWQTATQVSGRIGDSLNANVRGWQTAEQVSNKIRDSLTANSRNWQNSTQVGQKILDSLNANSRGWQNSTQVGQKITDSLSANTRGFQTSAQVGQRILDSLKGIYDSLAVLRALIEGNQPTYPLAPTNILATTDRDTVYLSWTNPVTKDSISIYRSEGYTEQYYWFATITGTTASIKDGNVKHNTHYSYRFRTYYQGQASASVYAGIIADSTANWYVYPSASGGATGRDWTNAWISFASINWNNIMEGDTLYISGGADSVVYSETLTIGKSGTANNLITITKGIDSGHNGRVVINNINVNGIIISNKGYLRIKNLELKNMQRGIFVEYAGNVIYIDSCKIYDWTEHGGIRINGSGFTADSIFIRWCTIEQNRTFEDGQTDCIYVQEGDNIFIYGNILVQKNNHTQGSIDNIQTYIVGNLIIYNNIMQNYNIYGSQCMILDGRGSDKVMDIYNNVAIHYGASSSGNGAVLLIRDYTGTNFPVVKINNNTLVVNGNNANVVGLQKPVRMKNNIIAHMGSGGSILYAMTGGTFVDSITNSVIYRSDPSTVGFGGTWLGNSTSASNFTSWTTWTVTLGGTGINSNPEFNNLLNMDLTLKSISPAINAGTNLGSPYNVDILGVSRPQGVAYDIGAYEYVP